MSSVIDGGLPLVRYETSDFSWKIASDSKIAQGYIKRLGQVTKQEAIEAGKKIADIFGQVICHSDSEGRYLLIPEEVVKNFRVKSVSIFRDILPNVLHLKRIDGNPLIKWKLNRAAKEGNSNCYAYTFDVASTALSFRSRNVDYPKIGFSKETNRLGEGNFRIDFSLVVNRKNRLRDLRKNGFDFQFSFDREFYDLTNIDCVGYSHPLKQSLTFEQIKEQAERITKLLGCNVYFLNPNNDKSKRFLFIKDDGFTDALQMWDAVDRNALTPRQALDFNSRELFIEDFENFLIGQQHRFRWLFLLFNQLGGKWQIGNNRKDNIKSRSLIGQCAHRDESEKIYLNLIRLGMPACEIVLKHSQTSRIYIDLKNVYRDIALWINFIENSLWSEEGSKIKEKVLDDKRRELEYIQTITGSSRSDASLIASYVDNLTAV